MNRRRLTMAVAGGVVALGAIWMAGSSLAQQPGFKRVELQRHDVSVPGHEVVQARVDLEPGAVIGLHTHPGEEVSYLLEGTLEVQVAGKPAATFKAGEPIFVPAETPHSAKNVGKGTAVVLATYFVEKGKPLASPVKQAAAAEAQKK